MNLQWRWPAEAPGYRFAVEKELQQRRRYGISKRIRNVGFKTSVRLRGCRKYFLKINIVLIKKTIFFQKKQCAHFDIRAQWKKGCAPLEIPRDVLTVFFISPLRIYFIYVHIFPPSVLFLRVFSVLKKNYFASLIAL